VKRKKKRKKRSEGVEVEDKKANGGRMGRMNGWMWMDVDE
jgi:hypothetical protein